MKKAKNNVLKENLWTFIKKHHENFEESRERYEEMVATAEDLASAVKGLPFRIACRWRKNETHKRTLGAYAAF